MPQSQWDQYNVPESQAQSPWEQYNITEKGTAIPTVAQKPGMPVAPYATPSSPANPLQQEIAKRAAGTLAGFPGGSPNVPSDWRAMAPGAAALGVAGAVAAPSALGPLAARYPVMAGAVRGYVASKALEQGRKLPVVGPVIEHLVPSKLEPYLEPILTGIGGWQGRTAALEKAIARVGEEKAAGQVIGGEERELLKEQMAKVFSGEAKSAELKAMSKGLKAGQKAGEAAAKDAAKALEQSKPLGGLGLVPDKTDRAAASWLAKQGVGYGGRRYGKTNAPIEGAFQQGGVVPKTGNYILHQGEAVLPNFSWTNRGPVGDAFQGLGLARTETPMSQRQSYYGPTNAPGMISPGNIDLYNRPQVKNKDGSISTLHSISIDDENGHSVLIPTVVGKKVVSNREAVSHYLKTGEHLGKFIDNMYADAHSYRLHSGQQSRYRSGVAPLGSLQQGTPYVPQTGPYQLHQGETVVPAPLNLADPTTGRAIASAAPGYLAGMARHTARQIADVSAPNIFYQMYRKYRGLPNTLHQIPKEAVNTWLNVVGSLGEVPGISDLITQIGMSKGESAGLSKFADELAADAKSGAPWASPWQSPQEGVLKIPAKIQTPMAVGEEVPRGVRPGAQVRWSQNISKRMQEEVASGKYSVAWPEGQELPPRMGETYRHGYGDVPVTPAARYPTQSGSAYYDVYHGPQPGPYQSGTTIPWSPDISRMMQQGQAAPVTVQQALQRAQKASETLRNLPTSVPIGPSTNPWGY